MEQFVVVNAFVYNSNNSLNSQAVTKPELLENQSEQNPT